MPHYEVVLIDRPGGWKPGSADDVPPSVQKPREVLCRTDDLREAVGRAVEHNREAEAAQSPRWAVVVEPGSRGRTWPAARLCTPLGYKVAAIWWPEGWEPESPLDVPGCLFRSQGDLDKPAMSYRRAAATVRSLNRQCMAQPGTTWYVVVAVENEPVSQTVSFDAAGTETKVEVRRVHLLRPEQGGRGNCSHCPAQSLPCSRTDWSSQVQTVASTESRPSEG
jgi:hypothetical protein